MTDRPRLIERAFPLKQTSLDSVHEKNVRHGHISTLHVWPARRPLAACRAALIATLLPDPGTPEKRKELCEKFAGKVVERKEKKKLANGQIVERVTEETEGGILYWKRETENKDTLEWFRQEIRMAYGGRAPKVLDPFAGGGAIPLEAMRLGCEVTASDINPVAWFILKCTLEYPQKLAGQTRPLPDFILKNREFMTEFFKAKGVSKKDIEKELEKLGHGKTDHADLPGFGRTDITLEADLAWHVRAWGQWVLDQARRELAPYYPTYADFEPLKEGQRSYEKQPMRLVPNRDDGTLDMGQLNGSFSEEYLRDPANPRWVAKPTVAYLWARTVRCKNCRATIPLLKTLWLCNKVNRRVLLTIDPNADSTGVDFGIATNVPKGNDRKLGQGSMSRAGAQCLCCPSIMTMEDIRLEGRAGATGEVITVVVVNGPAGKEYRRPTAEELAAAQDVHLNIADGSSINSEFAPASTRSISCQTYGVQHFSDLFTSRQRRALSSLSTAISLTRDTLDMARCGDKWALAIHDYLALSLDRAIAFSCVNVRWKTDAEAVVDAFSRFSISLLWDYAEPNMVGGTAGGWALCFERIATAMDNLLRESWALEPCQILNRSATDEALSTYDVIITDPPYYEAVSYADLSDFFYVWLRSLNHGLPEFASEQTPKDSEAVQHVRCDKDRGAEKTKYEQRMFQAFRSANLALAPGGRFVCVFAHKDPAAWETLVSAMIKAGFTVMSSWPIQDNMPTRQRASATAALASSVWLVCQKRIALRPGWAKDVLNEMQSNIADRLTEFWDAGIRGPDFVWAALGPALEAYSKYPVVKTDRPESPTMSVSEFLTHVRRLVIDFVVGRVLSGGESSDLQMADKLDGVTAYYLLHRNDFRMAPAPSGACILYALSCGVSDHDLAQVWGLTASGKQAAEPMESDGDEDGEDPESSGSGSEVRLLAWTQRKSKSLGYEAPGGRDVPIVDRIHRLMILWSEGDVQKVDAFLDDNALRRNELFRRVLQAIIELADKGSEERSLLESISNHIQGKGAVVEDRQRKMFE